MGKIIKQVISPEGVDGVMFCGDIHGEFNKFRFTIKSKHISNYNIFMCGDFGMGFHKPNYYTQELRKLNKYCQENNNIIWVVRGNHDNPLYFTKDTPIEEFSNIKFVEDYSVITIQSPALNSIEEYNVLCIGGAHSVDRTYRRGFFGTVTLGYDDPSIPNDWWKGEVVTKKSLISLQEEIAQININVVCTHTVPSRFNKFFSYSHLDAFISRDNQLYYDLTDEQAYLDSIYDLLVYKDSKASFTWVHGHFHYSDKCMIDNNKKISLGIDELVALN